MAYKQLVQKNVRLAFKLVQNLAIDVQYLKKVDTEFDFAANEVSETVIPPKVVKTVVLDSKKRSSEKNSQLKEIMLIREDLGDISAYDRVLIGLATWKIGPVINDDGYVIYAEISKEV
jgi:hypothetical protein